MRWLALVVCLVLYAFPAWAQSTSLDTGLATGGMQASGPATVLDTGPRTTYSVLHIMSDDIGDEGITAACAGDCATNMPTLDAMRTNGISFSNFWVTPACGSTRATILTGRWPYQHGITGGAGNTYLPRAETEIPEGLWWSTTAYKTAMVGKLGLSAADITNDSGLTYVLMGFDYFWGKIGVNAGDWFDYSADEGTFPYVTAAFGNETGDYLGDDTYDQATAWVQGLATGQQFVLFLWPNHAHANSYHDPPGSVTPPGDADNDCEADPDFTGCQIAEIRYMDTKMGEVITAALAHDSSTLVIYHMDNGDALVATNGKGTVYLDGIRGEAVFAYGNIPTGSKNTTSTEPLMAIDIFPTIMDYAQADNLSPNGRRGWSLRKLVSDECTPTGQANGSCWDGTTPRCQYSQGESARTMYCESGDSAGYRYKLDNDGSNPEIYEVSVSDTVECSDSACDDAEAELGVLLPAYDGLPGPS